MNALLEQVSSIGWWVSVVLVGVLTSLLASYLKPRIDNNFSRVWRWWANRSEKERTLHEAYIRVLRNYPDTRDHARVSILNHHFSEVRYLLFAIILFLLALNLDDLKGPFFFAGTLCFLLAFRSFSSAERTRQSLVEATRIQDVPGPPDID